MHHEYRYGIIFIYITILQIFVTIIDIFSRKIGSYHNVGLCLIKHKNLHISKPAPNLEREFLNEVEGIFFHMLYSPKFQDIDPA